MAVNTQYSPRSWVIGREVLGAFLLACGLVAVSTLVQVQIIQLPGYLLLLGSDLIQNPLLPGLTGWAYTVFFAGYLYGVAIIGGNLYRLRRALRTRR